MKLADASRELAEKERGKVQAILQKQVDKGKVSADRLAAIVSRIEAVEGLPASATAISSSRRRARTRT